MPLNRLDQRDFSAGMFRSLSPHRIPSNGCYDLENLLIDNQGLPWQRGGVEAFSNPATSSAFSTVHDILTAVGRRTFWATATEMGVLDPVDGATPIKVNPGGVFNGLPPVRVTVIGGRAYFDYGAVYAGATREISYAAGTIAYTQGSTTIVGSGVDFVTNLTPGAVLTFGTNPRNYVVASITNATTLELTSPYKEATGSTANFSFRSVGHSVAVAADIYGTAGRRLLASGGQMKGKDKLYFSRNQDPINEITRSDGSFQAIESLPDEDPENFHDGDYHQIPGSPEITGLESWGSTAIVFTTDGVWQIGNMDLEPVDAAGYQQHQLVHSAPQVVLWHRNGLAKFADALIVPARDGVYIMGSNSLERIDTPITPLYRDYVRQGYGLGVAAVYEGHYFLPVIDASMNMVDLLVCRLDRPVETRGAGTIRPWSHFSGVGIRALAIQETGGNPRLLVAPQTGNRILRARYFEPESVSATDNGTAFTSQLITRDFPTGGGNQNVTRRIDVDYDLADVSPAANPTIEGAFATGHPVDTAAYTAIGTAAPAGTDQLQRWMLADPPRSRYVRVRLRTTGQLKSLLIRSIAIWTRSSTKSD